jgi:type VI secretion system protein ImpK
MREEIADLVYPVIAYGLNLRERLDRREQPDLTAEQSELRSLLKTANEAQRWPDFGGDGDRFLGIRYALTCWLDEVMIDSPWQAVWRERKLEEALYNTNDRAWKFWHQARLAQGRASTDTVEVFYLCVMLGFRGEGPERPETIYSWRDAVEAQLSRLQAQQWPGPGELQPEVNALPRRGRDALRRVLVALGCVLAVIIPSTAYYFFK